MTLNSELASEASVTSPVNHVTWVLSTQASYSLRQVPLLLAGAFDRKD